MIDGYFLMDVNGRLIGPDGGILETISRDGWLGGYMISMQVNRRAERS